MTKAETSKRAVGTGTPRGKGSYNPHGACDYCRSKKARCIGSPPVCMTCLDSERGDECTWTGEPVRKNRTEAHFEAMRKRADALREYANLLESLLDKCRREHGGNAVNGQSYLQFRPLDADAMILPNDMGGDPEDEEEPVFSGVVAKELCAPEDDLKFGEDGLYLHRNTAIFRFAPKVVSYAQEPRFPMAEDPNATYVLLVDGVDESHYNPDFDWSRHLPQVVPLDRREHDKILSLLFAFFTSWCQRIVPSLFLRDMYRALSVRRSQTPPKTTHYSPILHNSLIALATGFSDDPRIRDIKAREYFATAAKDLIEAECQKPNISVVHALSILGSYHSSRGEQTLGYMYFGMSARISQALGLSTDCSGWVGLGMLTKSEQLDRNWAHWTIFTQDVCWSLYVGRDFTVPAPTEANHIPFPYIHAEFDQVPWSHRPTNMTAQPNNLSKTFAASCELLMLARRIQDVVNGLNTMGMRREVSDELVTSIDLQLHSWKSKLPTELDITLKSRPTALPWVLMMHLAYWWLFILLHRPFYHRTMRASHPSNAAIDHVKLCKRAADNIMDLLATYRMLYSLRYCPITLVQTVFSAGTVYLLVAVKAASGSRVAHETLKSSLSQVNLCLQYLQEIGKSWQCATNIAEILRNLLRDQVKPLLDGRSMAIEPEIAIDKEVQNKGKTATMRSRTRTPRKKAVPQTLPQLPVQNGQSHLVPSPLAINLPISFPTPTPPSGSSNLVEPQGHGQRNHPWPDDLANRTDERDPRIDPALYEAEANTSTSSIEATKWLTMMGNEPFSDAGFMPDFSMDVDVTSEDYLQQQLDSVTIQEETEIPISESDLNELEQIWDVMFSSHSW